MTIPFSIIVAIDKNKGIGNKGQLPWHLPADLTHFKNITTKTSGSDKKNVVIMGRKTWESLPERFRPLPGRINVVLSRKNSLVLPQGVYCANDFDLLEKLLKSKHLAGTWDAVFIIGGEQVFRSAIIQESCQKLYITHLHQAYTCDTFFPDFEGFYRRTYASEIFEQNGCPYQFCEYEKTES